MPAIVLTLATLGDTTKIEMILSQGGQGKYSVDCHCHWHVYLKNIGNVHMPSWMVALGNSVILLHLAGNSSKGETL